MTRLVEFRAYRGPVLHDLAAAEPFATAEEAWFWTMSCLMARAEGARVVAGKGAKLRPCDPDDVVKSLDRLWRQRRIDLSHVRVLRRFGEAQVPPDARHPGDRGHFQLWTEALARLEGALVARGIVQGGHTEQADPIAAQAQRR